MIRCSRCQEDSFCSIFDDHVLLCDECVRQIVAEWRSRRTEVGEVIGAASKQKGPARELIGAASKQKGPAR